jgi:peptidoglycan/xylan/chitin deacetylase (PgdA/CDA1 family)
LLLWETPPGLERILAQEGVPYEVIREAHPLLFRGARFVMFDSRTTSRAALAGLMTPDQVAIDVDGLRRGEPRDPFAALVDTRAARASWRVGSRKVTERVARHDKGRIRRRLIGRLRHAVTAAGGAWIRLAPFPYPYRSAFGFRADLDEPLADDYFRFARARVPLDDCCTHFVSTHAYAQHPSVVRDLEGRDTQSHGHFHHVYQDPEVNRRNLERAHRILVSLGFEPTGFAAPHGRWNAGLDDALEDFGYLYSSDFQLGYDDFPFFPWKGDRFSRVLQIPVHPVCEGLFLEAGISDGEEIGEYLAGVVASRLGAGELAIAYGHPERRLGRMPEVLRILSQAVDSGSMVWRVTIAELARWWRWRAERRWLVIPREDQRIEIQFADWDAEYDVVVEIQRGDFFCSVPMTGPRMSLSMGGLAYERSRGADALPEPPRMERRAPSLKQAIRVAIDWETVTPLDEIPGSSLSGRVKRGLRWWKLKRAGVGV